MLWIYVAIPTLFLISMFSFEYLVWYEFTYQRKRWIKDGKPRGFFWDESDPFGVLFARTRARQRCGFIWMFWTPDWIDMGKYPKTALTICRASTAAMPPIVFFTLFYLYFKAYG